MGIPECNAGNGRGESGIPKPGDLDEKIEPEESNQLGGFEFYDLKSLLNRKDIIALASSLAMERISQDGCSGYRINPRTGAIYFMRAKNRGEIFGYSECSRLEIIHQFEDGSCALRLFLFSNEWNKIEDDLNKLIAKLKLTSVLSLSKRLSFEYKLGLFLETKKPEKPLTATEVERFRQMVESEFTLSEIALQSCITENTLKSQLSSIYLKLGYEGRGSLVMMRKDWKCMLGS
jgi:DNA-binding CsgD family transcriptional regulator